MLTIDAVRRSIEALQKSNIHEQFLGYLHARKCGVEQGSMVGISPDWSEVSRLLAVDGGPVNKPHFLPMTSRNKSDQSRFWLNPHIPGSFAPSSIRKASQFMLSSSPGSRAAGKFYLPADHAEQALAGHLNGARRPVWPLAGFLLRNYSFSPSADGFNPEEGVSELIEGFRRVFRFDSTESGSDFDTLFTVGDEPDIDWFQPMQTEEPEADSTEDEIHV